MCAIAGLIGKPLPDVIAAEMLQSMHRRGPDERGAYRNKQCTLLHTRLTIIDADSGKQPMELAWAGEEYCIVYNGELYNTQEVKSELLSLGHCFNGHSDTEAVLHAYAQWGSACLEKLNGIYAFAIWESKKERLFFARDRIGVKPLFFTEMADGFLFASEIKTLFCHPEVSPQIDRDGIMQVMLLGPGRKPGSGVFYGIRELEPGQFGVLEKGKIKICQYWKLRDYEFTDSFEDAAEKIRYLVLDAIKRQMVSDVGIGCFLSGGLDSSIISAVCSDIKREAGERLHTFSVDYLNNEKYFQPGKFQPSADTAYIEEMLRSIMTEHSWTVLSPEDLIGTLEEATIARDLPGMADVDFSLLSFCKRISAEEKVVLSGECADEIFGGYPWYRDPEVRMQHGFPWSQTTKQRASMLNDGLVTANEAEEYVMDAYRKTCDESDILPENVPEERRMKEMVNLNFRWFMQTLLDRKDRMSMYNGLEVRVPFCDYRIAEYLYGVPWAYKDYKGQEKGLLRYAVRDILPDKILTRKKSPYPKTFDPEYARIVSTRLTEILNREDSPMWYFIRKSALRSYLKQEGEWPWYGQLMRRPQTIAYFLQIDFWLRHFHVDFRF